MRLFSKASLTTVISLLVIGCNLGCRNIKAAEPNTLPEKSPETRQEWKSVLNWPIRCDEGVSHFANDDDFVGVEISKLKSGNQLISVVCTTGAYNRGKIIYFHPKNSDKYTLLTFNRFGLTKNLPDNLVKNKSKYYRYLDSLLWGSALVKEEDEIIYYIHSFRGAGGCGINVVYDVSTEIPKVLKLRIKPVCGLNMLSDEDWPEFSEKEYKKWPLLKHPDAILPEQTNKK